MKRDAPYATRRALLPMGALITTAVVAALLPSVPPAATAAASCDKEEIEIGIVKATGCFVARTPSGDTDPVYDTVNQFRMNGFDVKPHTGVRVTFQPATTHRGATVTTNNGFVDMSAVSRSGTWGTIHFENMLFAFTPPKTGEVVIANSALAQPFPAITGLTPLGVSQPIKLTEEGAEFNLSFSIGGFFLSLVTGSEKQLAAGIGFEVKDGKFAIASGQFKIASFELAHLLTINEGRLEIGADKFDIDADGVFNAISGYGVIFGTTVEGSLMKRAQLGVSDLNKPLGTSGIFLQKLAVTVYPNPPYGGAGTIGLSAGPKTRFFGRDVTAIAADGTVEVRSADTANNKPPYFRVGGNFSLMTLPVGDASFAYYFGQGTQFAANVGIGLPSGTNDPGQPTYVGGGVLGWTSAQHFDLEGNLKLKLLGIDLLGAQTVISDIGFAGCLQVVAWIGGGVRWSDGRAELLGGFTCDVGGYRPQPGATRQLNSGNMRVRLDKGKRIIRLVAPTGASAPEVQVTGADGQLLTSTRSADASGIQRFQGGATIKTSRNVTALVLQGQRGLGRGAVLHVRPLPGSSTVTRVESARILPKPRVKAWVTGSGRSRLLHWKARAIKRQNLYFSEVLPTGLEVPIASTQRSRGTIRFRPVEGLGTFNRKRRIRVDVRQRLNTPRRTLLAGQYRLRPLPAPDKVTRLRVHREVGDVVATWHRASGARKYRIEAKALGPGAIYAAEVRGNRTRVRIPVGTSGHMRVSVIPINAQGLRGRRSSRILDTSNLVPSLKVAARRIAARAIWNNHRRLLADAPCPDGGSCSGVIRVQQGGRTIGRTAFTVPPDLTDRVIVKLSRRPRKGARVVVTLWQSTTRARATGTVHRS